MGNNKIIAVLHIHKINRKVDIEIPLDITANELVIALNKAYDFGIDTDDLSQCFLRSENPVAFLKGNKLLSEYGLRNGTLINHI